ncbi:MAG: L-histidine N(alpha)-methyltransferase [Gemmataceae bacterium]
MMLTCTFCSAESSFRADVLAGLSQPHKQLAAKYFYDEVGSRLFERITELDEYYPTRTERTILQQHVSAMAAKCGPEVLVIEPGAGSLVKVRHLLKYLERPAGFIPVDVSGEHLRRAAVELAKEYPALRIRPVIADFTRPYSVPAIRATRRVIFFPGSTLGNFEPPEADALMRQMARQVGSGGGVLLGVDLQKDIATLEAAYNDAQGVTAEFNRNLLARINRELDGEFDLSTFAHRAFFNRERSRIEMHLVSQKNQRVRVADHVFTFHRGESIHTENSYKYNLTELRHRASRWNLCVEQTWTDDRAYFALLYLVAK